MGCQFSTANATADRNTQFSRSSTRHACMTPTTRLGTASESANPETSVPQLRPETKDLPSLLQPSSCRGASSHVAMKLLPLPDSGFVSSYDPEPEKNFAFLVPGDEELFVGGGALNGAVGKLLLSQAGQPIAFTQDTDVDGRSSMIFHKDQCVYRKLHEKLFSKTADDVGGFVVGTKSDCFDSPVTFAAGRSSSSSIYPFGTAFLDIFDRDKRPFGCKKNVGLLYTAGPLGKNAKAEGEGPVEESREAHVKTHPEDFLAEVRNTASNMMRTVTEYNAFHAGKSAEVPPIEVVRVPIISGGIFKHPDVEKHEVALAILWGIHAALASVAKNLCPDIELMPDLDMEKAYNFYQAALQRRPQRRPTVLSL